MKKVIFLFAVILCLFGCNIQHKSIETDLQHPEWVKDAIIYEVNVRQYTPEGTFAALENHLDRLQKTGIDILWMMPIYPIGVEERKGTLGSYYAVQDYYGVNPEFGTIEDFKHFLNKAHQMEFKVILDWVANHTSRDAVWVKENPEWFCRDSLGNIATLYDWTDVSVLNYEKSEVREAMISAMKYWVEVGVDGFRCDVAAEVPVDFWNECTTELREVSDSLFFLAEAEKDSLQFVAFDSYYSWKQMQKWYDLASGKINADSLADFYVNYEKNSGMPHYSIPMNFTSNHDQNSWTGTDIEKFGEAYRQFAVLSFVVPGMPMIYSGQEASLDKRLKFFVKDTIDWANDKFEMGELYKSLIKMRDNHASLWAQPWGGTMLILPSDKPEQIFAFEREVEGDLCLAMFNFSNKEVTFNVENHIVTKDNQFTLPPHGYNIIFSLGDYFGNCDTNLKKENGPEK
ncbi:MAG: alpha-amylase family glycosyl hydrolase [Bacteroidales bacterium]|nr:alpha-amylase family glycosyl hydrolase [Bacteroidales bacterium]